MVQTKNIDARGVLALVHEGAEGAFDGALRLHRLVRRERLDADPPVRSEDAPHEPGGVRHRALQGREVLGARGCMVVITREDARRQRWRPLVEPGAAGSPRPAPSWNAECRDRSPFRGTAGRPSAPLVVRLPRCLEHTFTKKAPRRVEA